MHTAPGGDSGPDGAAGIQPTAQGDQDISARLTVAVILAGGVGLRSGSSTPKQLVPVAGHSSLAHTITAFQRSPNVDKIIVMAEASTLPEVEELLRSLEKSKLSGVFPGGATRAETSMLALNQIPDPDSKVLLHDGVRPLLSQRVITECVEALDRYDAVDTAIPSADTIIEVDDENLITSIPPRSRLRRGQTPQGFRRSVIQRAYELAMPDAKFITTDDCGVVLRYLPEIPIYVVDGDEWNIKITHPVDFHIADKLFQLRQDDNPTVGLNKELLRDSSVVIFGASYGIGAEIAEQLRDVGACVHSFSRTLTDTDVQDRQSVRQALAGAYQEAGFVDHVILTAGLLEVAEVLELTDKQLADVISTNLTSAFLVAQESHDYLEMTHGSLLFFTSSSYTRGRARYSAYSATKAGLVNLTQALAEEWLGRGIRVNCISPSRTATPMRLEAFGPEPLDTLAPTSRVADTSIRALLSPLTGQIYNVPRETT